MMEDTVTVKLHFEDGGAPPFTAVIKAQLPMLAYERNYMDGKPITEFGRGFMICDLKKEVVKPGIVVLTMELSRTVVDDINI